MARKRKWSESSVKRGPDGRFVAQAGHSDRTGVQRRDVKSYGPQNIFDPRKPTRRSPFSSTNATRGAG